MALITYKIVNDEGGKVKKAARVACNFWNGFVAPNRPVVIRLGVAELDPDTIAEAFEPYTAKGVVYGRINFNGAFLGRFSVNKAAGTIVHEIGHTLGFGFAKWMELFDEGTGVFKPKPAAALPLLDAMRVELDGDDGTELSHWDEDRHRSELMTGEDDRVEHVLPVTIAVMALLGHKVKKRLPKKTPLAKLLTRAARVKFTKKVQAKKLDLDLLRLTPRWETLPHHGRRRRARTRVSR
jgi:hypothetical protein